MVRLITFYVKANMVGDERGFAVGKVYENLGVENYVENKPALLQNAINQAATIEGHREEGGQGRRRGQGRRGRGPPQI